MTGLFGGAIVVFCSAYIGILLARKLYLRSRQLAQIQAALGTLEFEITFLNLPLTDALYKVGIGDSSPVDKLFLQFSDQLRHCRGMAVKRAFERALALNGHLLALADEDKEILLEFAGKLGGGDKDSQVQNIRAALIKLKAAEDEASEVARKNGSLYKGLGVLAGVFLVIVLI